VKYQYQEQINNNIFLFNSLYQIHSFLHPLLTSTDVSMKLAETAGGGSKFIRSGLAEEDIISL